MFEFESGLILWTCLSFGVLVILLYRFALPSIIKLLAEREKMISGSLAAASEAQKKAEEALAENKRQLMAMRQQADKMMEAARNEGDKMKVEIVDKAQKKAEFIIEQAKGELLHEKEKIVSQVRQEAAGLIAAASEKFLRRTLTPEDNRRIIDESLKDAGI